MQLRKHHFTIPARIAESKLNRKEKLKQVAIDGNTVVATNGYVLCMLEAKGNQTYGVADQRQWSDIGKTMRKSESKLITDLDSITYVDGKDKLTEKYIDYATALPSGDPAHTFHLSADILLDVARAMAECAAKKIKIEVFQDGSYGPFVMFSSTTKDCEDVKILASGMKP